MPQPVAFPVASGVQAPQRTEGGAGRRSPQVPYLPRIASLNTLAGVNPTFLRAGILSGSPVCGLRPVRALSWRKRKVPRLAILSTLSFFTVLVMKATRLSRLSFTCRLESPPHVSASFFAISDFVIIPPPQL